MRKSRTVFAVLVTIATLISLATPRKLCIEVRPELMFYGGGKYGEPDVRYWDAMCDNLSNPFFMAQLNTTTPVTARFLFTVDDNEPRNLTSIQHFGPDYDTNAGIINDYWYHNYSADWTFSTFDAWFNEWAVYNDPWNPGGPGIDVSRKGVTVGGVSSTQQLPYSSHGSMTFDATTWPNNIVAPWPTSQDEIDGTLTGHPWYVTLRVQWVNQLYFCTLTASNTTTRICPDTAWNPDPPMSPPVAPVPPPVTPVPPPVTPPPVTPPVAPVPPPVAPVPPPVTPPPVTPPVAPAPPPVTPPPVTPPVAPVPPPATPVPPPVTPPPVNPPVAPVPPPVTPVPPPVTPPPVNPPVAPVPPPVAPVPPPVTPPPVTPPVAPVPPPVTPVSPPVTAPVAPVPPPVTAPVASQPLTQLSCNITSLNPTECTWFPGWHGPDCGCELRPVLDCVDSTAPHAHVAWWGYKVWCRPNCRRPDYISQSVGWGNRFVFGSTDRGQPTTFCTQETQYKRVFSSTFSPGTGGLFGLPIDMWILGHRIATILPNSYRSKPCTANHGNGGNRQDSDSKDSRGKGGLWDNHKKEEFSLSTETHDTDSELVGPEYPEGKTYKRVLGSSYFFRSSNPLWGDVIATGTTEELLTYVGLWRGSLSTYMSGDGVILRGRVSCSQFIVSGVSSVTSCFNVTSPDFEGTWTGCTSPSEDPTATTSEFSTVVTLPPLTPFSPLYNYEVHVVPSVPGNHWAHVSTQCIPEHQGKSQDGGASSLVASMLLIIASLALFM